LVIPGINTAVATIGLLASTLATLAQLQQGGEINAFDNAAEERYRCMLYCILDQDGTVNRAVLDEWYYQIQADSLNPFANEAAMLVNSVPTDHWQWLAYASSEVNPLACESCTCAEDRIISFVAETSTILEGNGHEVPVVLNTPDALPSDINVSFTYTDGTATAGSDYNVIGTSLTFPAGSTDGTTQTIVITIPQDNVPEPAETFNLQLSALIGSAIIDETKKDHMVTISANNQIPLYVTRGVWTSPNTYQAALTSEGTLNYRIRFSVVENEPNVYTSLAMQFKVVSKSGGGTMLYRARKNGALVTGSNGTLVYNSATMPTGFICASSFEIASNALFSVTMDFIRDQC
jgi:hypothetical protein